MLGNEVAWRARAAVAGVVMVVAGVAACGGGGDGDDAAGTEPGATTTAAPEVTTTEPAPVDTEPPAAAGPLPLGTKAAIVDQISGQEVGYVTVRSVAVDPGCSNPGALPPSKGHFLVVDISVGLYDGADAAMTLSGGEFRVEGADGAADHAAGASFQAASCDADRTSSVLAEIPPGRAYEGPIVLDSRHTGGNLVFAPIVPMTEISWAF